VIRVWAFGDVDDETFPLENATDPRRVWYQYFNDTGSYINYGEDGLQRLDYAVSSAERHGVKLVLVFVNEWSDWGGMDLYTKHFSWPEWVAWFDNPLAQAVYKRWVKILVERYRDSPAVFSWELANEPRCYGCNMDVIGHWAGNMSEYIKSMDPNHMVALGDEGWFNWPNGHYSDAVPSGVSETATDLSTAYAGFDGIDFVKNMYNPGLDYAVFHLYPSTWNYNDTWGNLWIEQHDDAGKQVCFPRLVEVSLEQGGSSLLKQTSLRQISLWCLKNTGAISQIITRFQKQCGKR
jgi:mannan endo-1,4-beta-mannosidase